MNVRLAILAALVLLATSCTSIQKSTTADDTWTDYGGNLLGHPAGPYTICYRMNGSYELSCVRSS